MPTFDNLLLFDAASVLLVLTPGPNLLSYWRQRTSRPRWAAVQRWVLASVFFGIAAKLALDSRR